MRHPGGVPEWPKGTGCKPVGSAYGGSNPPAPISRWAIGAALDGYRGVRDPRGCLGRGAEAEDPAAEGDCAHREPTPPERQTGDHV